MKNIRNQRCFHSQPAFIDVFSENSKEHFLKRLKNTKSISLDKQKASEEAAVLVPFCLVNNRPSILLTVRSALVGRNKGDVSFPGGMKEASDKDAIHAALRETEEEIGISPSISEVWTTMDPLPNRNGGIAITPVIAFLGNLNIENCQVNKDEVDSVFTQTLESFCDPNNWRYTQYKKGYTLPVFLGGEYRIWGLTAAILHIILQALLPDIYKNNFIFYKKIKIITNKKK